MNAMTTTTDLDRLAESIHDDLKRCEASREAWREAMLKLCEHLVDAREAFPDNQGFGRWCKEHHFKLNDHDRAALIEMGRDISRAHTALTDTKSRSPQLILKEFRLASASKTTEEKPAKAEKREQIEGGKITPELERCLAVVDRRLAAGEVVNAKLVEIEAGTSNIPARRAIDIRKTQAPVDPAEGLAPSAREKLDSAMATYRKRLEYEFDDRVREGVKKWVNEFVLPDYGKTLAQADLALDSRKSWPFTGAEFRQILAALHPDNSGDRTDVFLLVKSREILLRSPEKPHKLSGTLPRTVEELMAMRRRKARA